MAITAYGMFWSREEIVWNPGKGSGRLNGSPFELLGRHGKQVGKLRLLDARFMHGLYVLHSNYGAYYVGLANGDHGLGNRLHAHTQDRHARSWNAFSWFAFDRVLKSVEESGYQAFKPVPQFKVTDPAVLIRDLEAMLMLALGTLERGNKNQSKFNSADRWEQVALHERARYRNRLS